MRGSRLCFTKKIVSPPKYARVGKHAHRTWHNIPRLNTNINEDYGAYSRLRDIGRWHVTRWVRQVAASLPASTRVLDAGAGECFYKPYFAHCKYVGLDLAVGEPAWNYHNLDCISALEKLPFANNSFDAVLSTQTLEHLQFPAPSLSEIFRALKPGGKLFLTAPMAHMEHQTPYDFFRYTSFGLKALAAQAGFAQIEVTPFGGMFTRWAYEMPAALDILPRAGIGTGQLHMAGVLTLPIKLLGMGLIRLSQLAFLGLDHFDHAKNYPFGWAMTAVKP